MLSIHSLCTCRHRMRCGAGHPQPTRSVGWVRAASAAPRTDKFAHAEGGSPITGGLEPDREAALVIRSLHAEGSSKSPPRRAQRSAHAHMRANTRSFAVSAWHSALAAHPAHPTHPRLSPRPGYETHAPDHCKVCSMCLSNNPPLPSPLLPPTPSYPNSYPHPHPHALPPTPTRPRPAPLCPSMCPHTRT